MSVENVKAYFKKFGIENRILELDHTSATVEQAADTLGCKPSDIAKTLAFKVNENIIVVVVQGDDKIDNAKYKHTFKKKAKMVPFEEVETLVGHPVGGVCPFALKEGVKVYLDESLKSHEFVYPACGSCNSAIKMTIPELEKYSIFVDWVDVCKENRSSVGV